MHQKIMLIGNNTAKNRHNEQIAHPWGGGGGGGNVPPHLMSMSVRGPG